MTEDRLPLAELMAKTGDGDFLRSVAESVLQIIMEADVDGVLGAGRRTDPRLAREQWSPVHPNRPRPHSGTGRSRPTATADRGPNRVRRG